MTILEIVKCIELVHLNGDTTYIGEVIPVKEGMNTMKKYYVLRSHVETLIFENAQQGARWLSKIEYPNQYTESWMSYKQLSIAGRDKFEAKNIKEQLKGLGL